MEDTRRWEFTAAWLLAAVFFALLASLLLAQGHMLWASATSQGVWGCLAFGLASLLPGRAGRLLGLGPGGLRVPALLALALGLLLLSDGLSVLLTNLELRQVALSLCELRRDRAE